MNLPVIGYTDPQEGLVRRGLPVFLWLDSKPQLPGLVYMQGRLCQLTQKLNPSSTKNLQLPEVPGGSQPGLLSLLCTLAEGCPWYLGLEEAGHSVH